MKKVVGDKIRQRVKEVFRNDPTWDEPPLSISDRQLHHVLFPITKNQIYTTIRYMSLKAEDKVSYRIHTFGEFFDAAHKYVRENYGCPILLKMRGYGWREANQSTLDMDQRKRFKQGLQHFDFARNRSEKIESMLDKKEIIEEI